MTTQAPLQVKQLRLTSVKNLRYVSLFQQGCAEVDYLKGKTIIFEILPLKSSPMQY